MHRPRPRPPGDPKRVGHHLGYRARLFDRHAPLGDRREQPDRIDIHVIRLEPHRPGHLARDGDNRVAVGLRGGDAADRVDQPRPGGREHHPRPPGAATIRLGHERTRRLVPHRDESRSLVAQRIEDRHDRPTRNAKHKRHAFGFETTDEKPGTRLRPLLLGHG